MTSAFSVRPRADEFETLVSRSGPATLTSRQEARYAALLGVVADLRATPEVPARPDFVADLRSRLMAEAQTALLPVAPVADRLALPVRSRRRDRRIATLIGGAALLGATSSVAVAAQSALPGESLYPLKRAIESTQTRLAADGAERGAAVLGHATDRLAEIDQLTRHGTPEDVAAVPATLEAFTEQSTQAAQILMATYSATGDGAAINTLRQFTSTSMDHLLVLEGLLPQSAHDELVAAARNLVEIDDEARALCPTCTGGIVGLPPLLLSGATVDAAAVDGATGPSGPRIRTPGSTTGPQPIPGQDPTGIEVPPLDGVGETATDTAPVSPVEEEAQTAEELGDRVDHATSVPTTLPTTLPTPVPTAPSVGEVTDETGSTLDGVTGELSDPTGGLLP